MPVDHAATEYNATVEGQSYYFCSDSCMRSFLSGPEIAYFSMEIGIKSEIPTYSGGLGALAGDSVRSSADLKIPLVAVTLVSRKGYLKQKITDKGDQVEYPDSWDPSQFMRSASCTANVQIEGRTVKIRAWRYDHLSATGGMVPILFLDTDVEGNAQEDRGIADLLYGGDEAYRFKQEIVLGIGGVRILEGSGFKIRKYHMNEGHSSLLTLELLKKHGGDANRVRDLCVFTTHTPVEAGFDKFSYDTVGRILCEPPSIEALKEYGGYDRLNMTMLAINLSKHINGVTNAHMEYSKKLFPGHRIRAVTNGVHSYQWTCSYLRDLFDRHIPGWANEPELLVRVDEIPNEYVWNAHMKAKKDLIELVKEKTGVDMDVDKLTIGYARRATGYKRGTLVFTDLDRLKGVNRNGSIQLIFAGKAHPRDQTGKEIIREIYRKCSILKDDIKAAYLENYDMAMSAKLTSGTDVWLNTPMPPYEASGTSGMKAAHNGVLNFSVLDGWWIEGCIEDVTGWSIGPSFEERRNDQERRSLELDDLYDKLKYVIMPKFYRQRDSWVEMMKNSIGKVAFYFNSHRMMHRYITEAYL
jgi:starch phosphorylase